MHKLITTMMFFGVVFISHAEIFFPSSIAPSPRIRTVYWFTDKEGVVHIPILTLGERPDAMLRFDILDDEVGNNSSWLQASLKHAAADWSPENIPASRFLNVFNIFDIGFGTPSANALTTLYSHFELDFDKAGITPTISGNYILDVFPSENPDSIILSVPFVVQENNVDVIAAVSGMTDIDYRDAHQQLALSIDIDALPLTVTPQDITVIIGQNFTPWLWRELPLPSYISGNTLRYEHHDSLIFEAGNTFRRMETIDVNNPMMHVENIKWFPPFYHQFLYTDAPRNESDYVYDISSHGTYKIRGRNSDKPDVEADYTVVHFTLDGSEIPPHSVICLEGEFLGAYDKKLPMDYDAANNIYKRSLLLKQGAYSYRYLFPSSTNIFAYEGSFYPTENIYPVYVYYHVPGENYDRLAFAGIFSSDPQ